MAETGSNLTASSAKTPRLELTRAGFNATEATLVIRCNPAGRSGGANVPNTTALAGLVAAQGYKEAALHLAAVLRIGQRNCVSIFAMARSWRQAESGRPFPDKMSRIVFPSSSSSTVRQTQP